MSLTDDWAAWRKDMDALLLRLPDLVSRADAVMGHVAGMEAAIHGVTAPPPAPTPAVPAAPTPAPSPPVTDQQMWETPPRAEDAEYWAAVVRACADTGLHPEVLYAIFQWETGHGASRLWREALNPGGIKYNPALSAVLRQRWGADNGFAKFLTKTDAALGEVAFLLQQRYASARLTGTDVAAQVERIEAAGYSRDDASVPNNEWRINVTKLALALGTHPITSMDPKVPPVGALRTAVVALIGHPTGPDDPLFHYAPETEEGNLGCADAVSTALIHAGMLEPGELQLSVNGLDAVLRKKGWTPTTAPYRDGDVAEFEPRPGQTHPHVGVLIRVDGQVMVVNNSSTQRQVVQFLLDTYDRTIRSVLRAGV